MPVPSRTGSTATRWRSWHATFRLWSGSPGATASGWCPISPATCDLVWRSSVWRDSSPCSVTPHWSGGASPTPASSHTRWPPCRYRRSARGWWATTSRRTSAEPPGWVSARAGSPRPSGRRPQGPSSSPRRESVAFPTSKRCSSNVHGLILAGGEGSRLAAGGVRVPKPLVEVAGRPQIVGLLETFAALGCQSLTCAVRADFPAVTRLLDGRRFGPLLTVVECLTPSSLHTLVEGLRAVPAGPVFCTMVGTVVRPADCGAGFRATERPPEGGAGVGLSVTPYGDGQAPGFVIRGGAGGGP